MRMRGQAGPAAKSEVVWSNVLTQFYGDISARGGAASGSSEDRWKCQGKAARVFMAWRMLGAANGDGDDFA